jgi:hypothetical protein
MPDIREDMQFAVEQVFDFQMRDTVPAALFPIAVVPIESRYDQYSCHSLAICMYEVQSGGCRQQDRCRRDTEEVGYQARMNRNRGIRKERRVARVCEHTAFKDESLIVGPMVLPPSVGNRRGRQCVIAYRM